MAPSPSHLYVSPLRYPGGKRKVANFIKLLMLENDLLGCDYIEPYAGGASVALSLLFEDFADHIHINDVDRSIYAFWVSVLDSSDELCERIENVPVSMDEWHRQRAVQDDPSATDFDLGFSTFFLNRTARSGIIRGGVIGGFEQKGKWKIDARFNRSDLIRRIQRVARHRTRISVTCIDAAEFVADRIPGIEHPFLYLDPPYYVKGQGLYQNFYQHDDHAQVAELVKSLNFPWVVSYDSAPEIIEMYEGLDHIKYDLNYSAASRYRGAESMFFSPLIQRPDGVVPSRVSPSAIDQARLALVQDL